jgi:hypothetical protein
VSTRFDLVLARVSDDPAAVVRFLQTLGLGGGNGASSGVLCGRSGKVAVQSASVVTGASAGETHLTFMVNDTRAAADDLAKAGLDPVQRNRRVSVREPRGGGVWINEDRPDDESAKASGVDVVAVYYTTAFAGAAAFFANLGFTPYGTGDDWWQALRGSERVGVIGLHKAEEAPSLRAAAPDDPMGPPATVELGFETTEALPQLAERLRGAGYSDAVVAEDNGLVRVQVTDPDGQRLEIHPAA